MRAGNIAFEIRRLMYGLQLKKPEFLERFGFEAEELEDFLKMRYWVPVEEQLPKEKRDCLVTLRNGNITTGVLGLENPGEWMILPGVVPPEGLAPIAWMYLPESYDPKRR